MSNLYRSWVLWYCSLKSPMFCFHSICIWTEIWVLWLQWRRFTAAVVSFWFWQGLLSSYCKSQATCLSLSFFVCAMAELRLLAEQSGGRVLPVMVAKGQETLKCFLITIQVDKWILLILFIFGNVSSFNDSLKSSHWIRMFSFAGQNCYHLFQSLGLKASFRERETLHNCISWYLY